ncbi:hypothetical protein ACIBUY_40970 [Streptomyces sp. NPDC050085]|uniref:hypothetical protein n=1 Tax=Streptomyces sp. NPDC050085 TaxID=3365600 RepID=UPI00379ADCF3
MTSEPPSGATPPARPPRPGTPDTSEIRRLGALFGAVAAPTSFVTALLYYFGWHHAYWFFEYYGVNSTLLGLGTVDYLMRSLDALFVPMMVIAASALLAFWGHDVLRTRLAAGYRPQVLRRAVPVLAGVGFLLGLAGFWSVLGHTFLTPYVVLDPLSLASGVILMSYALNLRRALAATVAPDPPRPPPAPPADPDTSDAAPEPPAPAPTTPAPAPLRREWAAVAEWGALFVVLGLSLFWAANDYAASVGHGRAVHYGAHLASQPAAVLYSERDLSLDEPGVRELRCDGASSAYRYRYDGLVLILQSANQYVLVPRSWTPATGVAVVLPRSDSVRLEFVPVPAWRALDRTRC